MDTKPEQSNEEEVLETEPIARRWALRFIGIVVLLFLFVVVGSFTYGYMVLTQPPANFPVGERVVIEPGTPVRETVSKFKEMGFIRSEFVLYLTLIALHDTTDIKASSYRFTEPVTVFTIAERLTEGDYDTGLIRFVHYEGERVELLAERADELLPEFDTTEFLSLALPREGKLFPDTYLIPQNFTASDMVELLSESYNQRIAPLRPAIEASGYSEGEVIILASILEREANSRESKRMVAGILLSRLESGMPLQADASIEYTLGKPLSELTPADLDVDSPYNTYTNVGLPPTPIGNPGMDSIEAVLEPIDSGYVFYLTGRDGRFYYARTYAEHRLNIERYLR